MCVYSIEKLFFTVNVSGSINCHLATEIFSCTIFCMQNGALKWCFSRWKTVFTYFLKRIICIWLLKNAVKSMIFLYLKPQYVILSVRLRKNMNIWLKVDVPNVNISTKSNFSNITKVCLFMVKKKKKSFNLNDYIH